MNPVTPAEIQSLQDYELSRPALRKRMMDVKAARRVAIGDHLTLLFENHDTVLYQIQEMLRVERIAEPAAIAHEIATYNDLVGGSDEICATLLIEYADPAHRDARLRQLLGLEKHLALIVEGAGECRAQFDTRQMSEERISSVHYLQFELGKQLADAIRAGASVELQVDHPKMSERARLTSAQLAALVEDLSPS